MNERDAIERALAAVNRSFFDLTRRASSHTVISVFQPLVEWFASRHRMENPSFELLCEELVDGLGEVNASSCISSLQTLPLIHSGPHPRVLLDGHTLDNLVLATALARYAGATHIFWYAETGVSLTQRDRSGPAWLETCGNSELILEIPRSKRQHSVAALDGEARFKIPNTWMTSTDPIATTFRLAVDKSGSVSWNRFSEALINLNGNLFSSLWCERSVQLVQLDSHFAARLICRHLRAGGTPVCSVLFEPESARYWSVARSRANEAGAHFFTTSNTDYFWLLRDGRRRALDLRAGRFIERESGLETGIESDTESVIDALQQGRLIPGLHLMFLAVVWLPDVMVSGGPFQLAYEPLLRREAYTAIKNGGGHMAATDFGNSPATQLMFHLLDRRRINEAVPFDGTTQYVPRLLELLSQSNAADLIGELAAVFRSGRWADIAAWMEVSR